MLPINKNGLDVDNEIANSKAPTPNVLAKSSNVSTENSSEKALLNLSIPSYIDTVPAKISKPLTKFQLPFNLSQHLSKPKSSSILLGNIGNPCLVNKSENK